MAKSVADATAAPAEITLAGETYKLSPLTDQDYGEFDRWLQTEHLRLARESLSGDETEQERRETMEAAMRTARGLSLSSASGVEAASTLEGSARLLWLGLRKNHPRLEPSDVMRLLTDDRTLQGNPDPNAVSHAMDAFDMVNPTPEQSGDSAKKKRGKRGGRRRKRKSR